MVVNETLRINLVDAIRNEVVKMLNGNGNIEDVKNYFRPQFVFDLIGQGCPRQTARRVAKNTLETIVSKTISELQK